VPVPVDRVWDALFDPQRIAPCMPGASLERTIVIEGTGKDPKGSGAAKATVTAVLTQDGGSTTVATTTDLDVTGRPAQFGRGVMNDVANKLVGQFAANLDALLTSGDREAATPGHPDPGSLHADTWSLGGDRPAAPSGDARGW
jgi:carbon monoxide dehydrogenase subunit G